MQPAKPGRSRRQAKAISSELRSSRRSEHRPVWATTSRLSASARQPVASRPSRAWSAHCLRSPASPSSSSSIWRRNTRAHCQRSSRVTRRCQSFKSPTACAWNANHLYVIPPNVQMGLTDGYFDLRPRPDDRTQYTPIDSFLTSLAEHAQSRAIGCTVVWNGFRWRDRCSRDQGGRRDHVRAKTGDGEIPTECRVQLSRPAWSTWCWRRPRSRSWFSQVTAHPYVPHDFIPTSGEELRVRDDQLRRIFDLLRPASGIDFKQYKLPTIKRRLLRRMALQRLTDVQHYIRLLEETPAEVRSLYQDLLIHVTRFFREPESFKALAQQVFPKLVEDRGEEQPIRAWVSGCATGEEAYSLAI